MEGRKLPPQLPIELACGVMESETVVVASGIKSVTTLDSARE